MMIVIVKTLGSRVGSPTAEGEVRGGAKSKSRAFTSAKTKRKYKKLGHVLLVPPPMPFLPPQLCTLKRASFFLFAICNSTMSCFEFSSLLLCSCLIFFFWLLPWLKWGCCAHVYWWARQILFCGVYLRTRSAVSLVTLPLLPTLVLRRFTLHICICAGSTYVCVCGCVYVCHSGVCVCVRSETYVLYLVCEILARGRTTGRSGTGGEGCEWELQVGEEDEFLNSIPDYNVTLWRAVTQKVHKRRKLKWIALSKKSSAIIMKGCVYQFCYVYIFGPRKHYVRVQIVRQWAQHSFPRSWRAQEGALPSSWKSAASRFFHSHAHGELKRELCHHHGISQKNPFELVM